MDRPACRHCGREATHPRQLCLRHYRNRAVRALYPRLVPATREPTAEQVEATIAAQMERLPSWWATDAERQRRKAEGRRDATD